MSRILVVPEKLRVLSAQLQQAANGLQDVASRISRAYAGLDWEARQKVGLEEQVNEVRRRAAELAEQADAMARYVTTKAQAFEDADRQSAAELETVIRQSPLLMPVPTPISLSVENAVRMFDDLLKPIDWTSKKATKAFYRTLEEIGRLLNALTGRRGHIKQMRELGKVLSGTSKTVGAAGNLFDLRDFNRYFAGELTNQQVANTAIKALIPISGLNDKVAAWLTANMPDPKGKWRGLVPPVE